MAFFKFRLPGQDAAPRSGRDAAGSGRVPESVETLRRRARHRLMGASVLILAAVIGFPLLLDTQPRPVAVDVPITIPDRNKVKPLALPEASPPAVAPTPAVAAAPAASSPASVSSTVAASASLGAREEMVATKPASVAAAEKTQQKATLPSANGSSAATKTVAKASEPAKASETRPSENKPAAPDEAARARALLEGREPPKAAGAESARFIVQVGAFSDATKAREARMKVERAGLKTYTQVVETADGKRIRVRVGPFGQRAEADKAAERIRKLDLPAALLTL